MFYRLFNIYEPNQWGCPFFKEIRECQQYLTEIFNLNSKDYQKIDGIDQVDMTNTQGPFMRNLLHIAALSNQEDIIKEFDCLFEDYSEHYREPPFF